jgi:hypothetical protein
MSCFSLSFGKWIPPKVFQVNK